MLNGLRIDRPLALIVEDAPDLRIQMKGDLEMAGFQVLAEEAYAPASASLSAYASRLDLLVVDLYLPERARSTERPNLGWRLLAEAKQHLPFWCELVVCTAYGETRPAAAALKVMFIEKMTGDYDEKFLPFVSKWAVACQSRLNGTDASYPQVNADALGGDLDYQALMMCRAINDAKSVEVVRSLAGSFQEGGVLQVRLTPKDNAPDCIAVVKRGSLLKASQELAGQAKLMWYWKDIGKSLPPLRQYRSLLSSRELVLVTPFARGRTLSEVVKERWYADDRRRVDTFESIFQGVAKFLESIKRQSESVHGLGSAFTNAYLTVEAESRRAKTIPVLDSVLKTRRRWLTCVDASVTVPNPMVLFGPADEAPEAWHWREEDCACGAVTYGHGDFHVGNVMVELSDEGILEEDGLTVLDYDYVGEYCRHYDTAQLEASFLVELAMAFDDRCGPALWDEYVLPALKILSSSKSAASVRDKRFAGDLVRVINGLRGSLTPAELKLYYGALFTTLLRVSVSQSISAQRRGRDLPRSAQRTIVVMLGLLLDQLIEIGGVADEDSSAEVSF